jgi:RND family efflux transporter MFP subunit
VLLSIVGASAALLLLGGALVWYAAHKVNRTTLASRRRPVSFTRAQAGSFRDRRTYVGTIEPWIEANIGPQYISAYVLTVLVRPGSVVRRGQVVATLDCSNPNASSGAALMQARSVDARQRALADQSVRVRSMLAGGFVALNESEQKEAESEAEHARLLEARAKLAAATLGVRDCILRAPFDGEIATRVVDPGAFVRPGEAIVSIVDRDTVRVTADAPERDFDVIQDGTEVEITALSTQAKIEAPISRRAPKADAGTRTVHFEIDVADPKRAIPVGTTGVIRVEVGQPRPATEIPVYAAKVTEKTASLFVVDQGVAHRRDVDVLGEIGGALFLNPAQLPAGSAVITEGRELLADGDRVQAKADTPSPVQSGRSTAPRGAGSAHPF